MRRRRILITIFSLVLLLALGNASKSPSFFQHFRRKRLVLAADDPDTPGRSILLPLISDSFIPNCGGDNEEEEDFSSAENEDDPKQPGVPQLPAPAIWLGYSSKLFGGFFNLTIVNGEVRPFGRCVAASQKFSLIEQDQPTSGTTEHDRCYRCMFVDKRSSPLVVQMRTSSLQCLASPNNAGSDTLYRVCASLSPSLPLLTLLKISDTKSSTKCPFEPGNYRVSYEFSSCGGSSITNNACIDQRGVHLHLIMANSVCEGQLRGAVSFECLANWKADTAGDHHSFAFLRIHHGTQSTIRCAIYHHQRHRSGFVMAIASGFDCSELNNGLVLKSSPISRNHLNSHIFHFNQIIPETSTSTTTPIFSSSSTTTQLSTSTLQSGSSSCDLPNFVLVAKNWHSVDALSYQLVPTSSSSFTLYIGSGNKGSDRVALYLACVEPEIGGDPSSRIYQAVYSVRLNNPGKMLAKRDIESEFTCSAFFAKNSTTHFVVEASFAAKRAQRGQQTPSLSTLSTVTLPIKHQQRHRSPKTVAPYHRCVKFYQRDRHVIELVLGSPSNGPTSLVCADTIREDHRVLLVDGGIFMGYSAEECLSIPLPGFLSGQNYYQKVNHKHLQTPAIKTPPVEDVLSPACLVRLCSAISRRDDIKNSQELSYLVLRKGSTCPAQADPDVSVFYMAQMCTYRWRRDYVTDNLLFAPIVKMAPKNGGEPAISPLSCFILQHNGISLTVSTLIPNPNCWLNGHVNSTSHAKTSSEINNATASSLDRDEFIGFAFNAHDACHWPSESPSFVNSNNDAEEEEDEEDLDKSKSEDKNADSATLLRTVSGSAVTSRDTGDNNNFFENSDEFWSRLTLNKNSGAFFSSSITTTFTPFILFLVKNYHL